eukprot:937285-Alexandrium_andersonii.AAC.1
MMGSFNSALRSIPFPVRGAGGPPNEHFGPFRNEWPEKVGTIGGLRPPRSSSMSSATRCRLVWAPQ